MHKTLRQMDVASELHLNQKPSWMPQLEEMYDHATGQRNLPDTLEAKQSKACIGASLAIQAL